MKKPKQINLSEQAVKTLSVLAAIDGTNFKNYVESHLEKFAGQYPMYSAVKAVRQKKQKNGI